MDLKLGEAPWKIAEVSLFLDVSENHSFGVGLENVVESRGEGGHNVESQQERGKPDEQGKGRGWINECRDPDSAALAGVDFIVG